MPLRRPTLVLCLAPAIASAFLLGGAASAADPPSPLRRFAATNLNEVDDDFPYQGEYYGALPTPGGGVSQMIGLQVIARGAGEFRAVEYPGGLPGVGWYGGDKTYLRGHRVGNRLWLADEDHHNFIIANDAAWVIDEREPMPTWINKVQRISTTMGAPPPENAVVLFDGQNVNNLDNAKIAPDGSLEVGASTHESYLDYYLHIEFQLPYMPYARGQGRANSGIYLQRRYEVQILDSFGLEGEANECGGLYRYRRPDLNMCLPPLAWQTYDIDFRSPRFNARDRKNDNGRLIVWLNGYRVQDSVQLFRRTGHGRAETPELLPILLQNHKNPVRFRNFWLVDSTPPIDKMAAIMPPPAYPPGTPPGGGRLPVHREYWNWDRVGDWVGDWGIHWNY